MTIYGYSGKPGTGKSYSVVADCIVPALKLGRTIYHNMQLKEPQLRILAGEKGRLIYFPADVTPDDLVSDAPPGALIVIDESVRYWPTGTKANKVPPAQLEFFTKHRHNVGDDGRATDIVLICQDFGSQCASFIRELIEINYYTRKLAMFGAPQRYKLNIYDGVVKGDRPPESKLIKSEVHKYNPAIFACYVSHTNSRTGLAGEELADKKASVWKRWPVMAALGSIVLFPVACSAIISSFQSLSPDSKAGSGAASEHSEPAAPSPARTPQPPPPPPQPPKLQESASWRLAGRIVIDNLQYYLAESTNGQRYIKSDDCRFDEARNLTCSLDGQLVAEWTGPRPSNFQSITPQIEFGSTAAP